MHKKHIYIFTIFIVGLKNTLANKCGCKTLRPCYEDMLAALTDRDEAECIEDASIGGSTLLIFLQAIKQFCPSVLNLHDSSVTYEGRKLYEVLLTEAPKDPARSDDDKPVIIIEAGQDAGTETVEMALVIIEQIVACEENDDMLQKVKWIILPSTNPDGMEYSRYNRIMWKKNVKPLSDMLSFGVDLTRNFEYQWGSCDKVDSGFSPIYPGPSPASENETVFIKDLLNRYKKNAKVYLSFRRDGHSILYPYAFSENGVPNSAQITKVAAEVAAKVNQRAGGVQVFLNESIYESNGKSHCGHSVDYAYDIGIPLAYEMRLFLASNYRIMSMFQQLPRGYESSLRQGYLSGVREIYNTVVNDKKNNKGA